MAWQAFWSKRIKFTVASSKVDASLTNFHVMVQLDSACSGVFNEVGDNSKGIAVYDSNGAKCYVEVAT